MSLFNFYHIKIKYQFVLDFFIYKLFKIIKFITRVINNLITISRQIEIHPELKINITIRNILSK